MFKWVVPRSGLSIGNPDYERALAARWWGFDEIEKFFALDRTVQAFQIAVYRTQAQAEAVIADQAERKRRGRFGAKGKHGG